MVTLKVSVTVHQTKPSRLHKGAHVQRTLAYVIPYLAISELFYRSLYLPERYLRHLLITVSCVLFPLQ